MKKLFFILFLFCLTSIKAIDIYVSPNGSDLNDGTKNSPKRTPHSALRQARELRRLKKVSSTEAIYIYVKGGTYEFSEPLFIRPEDSGSLEGPTIFKSVKDEEPVFSGGMKISGWEKKGKFWVADVPRFNGNRILFRQFWVNGEKAIRAKNVSDFSDMDRILSNDKINEILWIPKSAVKGLTKSNSLELVIHQMWAIANLRVKDIIIQGDSAGIKFHNPEARVQFEHPWPQPMVKEGFNSAFYFTNSIELLDEPGEWFFDEDQSKLYYIPRKDEDMKTAETIVPVLERLVQIEGTLDRLVNHIQFSGISFNFTTWTRPSLKGHVPLQAGMYLIDAYKLKVPGAPGNFNKGIENQGWIGRPPAAVSVKNAKNVKFEFCNFEHLGSAGLDIISGSKHGLVNACVFRDIAGNGLQIGTFSDLGMETHLPYDPTDKREICSHQTISNNYITNVTNDDWGCVGILAGNVTDINIEHNEISEVSYTGISVGWGWTKTVNCMRNNKIHANYIHHYGKHMYDVAGIYTLSVQSKSVISENRVEKIYTPSYVHDPNHWFYLYTDEGSSFIEVKDNWTEAEKFLKNANGPGNTWENNGPQVSEEIKKRAGILDKYKWIKE